jgi:hypothetical protein
MSRKWFSVIVIIALATFLASVPSCGFNQHLVSIQIAPASATFGAATAVGANPSAFIYFSATGTYEHPPKTVDVTNLVSWGTDNPQVVQISSTGAASPGANCGIANISASYYDSPNLVASNSSTITVDGPISSGCPQGGALSNLAVTIGGGTGTVASAPAGINCGTTCAAQFTTGTTVTLTGTPISPSSSVTWANCDTSSGTTCTVFLEADRIVTATFN